MMKLLFLFFAMIPYLALGQTCDGYLYLQPDKKFEMSFTNKKGKPTGKQQFTVKEAQHSGDIYSSTVLCDMYNEKGKLMSNNKINVQCNKGVLGLDMKIFIPEDQNKQFQNATATTKEAYIEYPYSIKAGDALKDGNIVMEIDNNGFKQKLSVVITDRHVQAAEKLTTPAGSWDTFRITSKTLLTIETMGIPIKFNIEGTEWFAPGTGTIKTESKHGTSELTKVN